MILFLIYIWIFLCIYIFVRTRSGEGSKSRDTSPINKKKKKAHNDDIQSMLSTMTTIESEVGGFAEFKQHNVTSEDYHFQSYIKDHDNIQKFLLQYSFKISKVNPKTSHIYKLNLLRV